MIQPLLLSLVVSQGRCSARPRGGIVGGSAGHGANLAMSCPLVVTFMVRQGDWRTGRVAVTSIRDSSDCTLACAKSLLSRVSSARGSLARLLEKLPLITFSEASSCRDDCVGRSDVWG